MSYSSRSLDPRETAALRALLSSTIGFDPDVLGSAFLESVSRRCQFSHGTAEWRDFLRSAGAGGAEWQRLLRAIVVSETWFFRDRRPFDDIVTRVAARWQGARSATRIFSCPCSTGEEPYSVAIALTQAGLPRTAFEIDAADVSALAIQRAQEAKYGPRSFRACDAGSLAPFFEGGQSSRFRELKPEIRKMVRFRVANLLDLGSMELGSYDIVLCRNLLIYLHEDARSVVMSLLRAMLAEDGVLIVGHAEAAIAMGHGFRSAGDRGAFAFVAAATAPVSAVPARLPKRIPTVATATSLRIAPEMAAPLDLQQIRDLGDRGHVDAALQACSALVRRDAASAEGYYLLGVLLSASGNEVEAENALRRAVYLDPNHDAALEHLALAQEAKGNAASAQRLRARIRQGEIGRSLA